MKNFTHVIDFTEFNRMKAIKSKSHTDIEIYQRNKSSSKIYIFKRFNYNLNNGKDQSVIFQTFYQICNKKCQYLQSYKYLSLFHNKYYKPTFIMKYISSTTLEFFLKGSNLKEKWGIRDVMRCLFAVAKGILFLHNELSYHGNLCPSNIIIDSANQCYVCDFGLYPIKKLFYKPKEMYNADYKDPLLQDQRPGRINDVYSYGVLTCQLCLLYFRPESKESLHEFITKVDSKKFVKFPTFFKELICDCMNMSPLKRPTFQQIVTKFQRTRAVIDDISVRILYQEFEKVVYVVNLANSGDSNALNKLGKMYEKGKVFGKDLMKALECYQRATLINVEGKVNSAAFANYGSLLQKISEGKNEDDMRKGADFLRQSAEQGDLKGMMLYGIALKDGKGVDVDLRKAEEYLKKAADFRLSFAQLNYALLLVDNYPDSDEKIAEALHYIKMAIDQGSSEAYYHYGLLLLSGNRILQKNVESAMENLKIAADLGNEKAKAKYDECLSELNKQANDEVLNDKTEEVSNIEIDAEEKQSLLTTKTPNNESPKLNDDKLKSQVTENDDATLNLQIKESEILDLASSSSSNKLVNESKGSQSLSTGSDKKQVSAKSEAVKDTQNKQVVADSPVDVPLPDSEDDQDKVSSSSYSDLEDDDSDSTDEEHLPENQNQPTSGSPSIPSSVQKDSAKAESKTTEESNPKDQFELPMIINESQSTPVVVKSNQNPQSSQATKEGNINGNLASGMQLQAAPQNLNRPFQGIQYYVPGYVNIGQVHSVPLILANPYSLYYELQKNKGGIITPQIVQASYETPFYSRPVPAQMNHMLIQQVRRPVQPTPADNHNAAASSRPNPSNNSASAAALPSNNKTPTSSSAATLPSNYKTPTSSSAEASPSNNKTPTSSSSAEASPSNFKATTSSSSVKASPSNRKSNTSAKATPSKKSNTTSAAAESPNKTVVFAPITPQRNRNGPIHLFEDIQETPSPQQPQVPDNPIQKDYLDLIIERRAKLAQENQSNKSTKVYNIDRFDPERPPFTKNTPAKDVIAIFSQLKNGDQYANHLLFKYEKKFIETKIAKVIFKFGKLYDLRSDGDPDQNKSKAMEYYIISANLGYAKAQGYYGSALQRGKEIPLNAELGFQYLEKSALQGDLNGISNYGLATYMGDGTQKNEVLGLKYLKYAADEGYVFAMLQFGICTYDLPLGHKYVEMAAEANYKKAFFYYGNNFLTGNGTPVNYEKAKEIFLNLYEIQYKTKVLVKLIECEIHINYKEALHYIKILADLDDKDFMDKIYEARYQYGIELYYGKNLPKNVFEAVSYLKKSNSQSKLKREYLDVYNFIHNDYANLKKKVNSFLTRNGGAADANESKICNDAMNGDVNQMFAAAEMIEEAGEFKISNYFYEAAADANHAEAAYRIGKYYLNGLFGLQVNESKGKRYIHKAASLGHLKARLAVIKYQMKLAMNPPKNTKLIKELKLELNEIAAGNFVPAIIYKAEIMAQNHYNQKARVEIQKALQLANNDPKILLQIARILLNIDDDNFAVNLIESKCKNEPKSDYYLGCYYYKNKELAPENLEKAEMYLTKAAENKIKNSQRLLTTIKVELAQRRVHLPTNNYSNSSNPDESCEKTDKTNHSTQPQSPQSAKQSPNKKSAIVKLKNKKETVNQPTQKEQQKTSEDPKEPEVENIVQPAVQANVGENGQAAPIDPTAFINLNLPSEELLKKGDEFRQQNILSDAFQCYEAVAKRGDPLAYFKCAEVVPDFEKKLQYYEFAVLNKVDGAFTSWRKCIYDHIMNEKNKQVISDLARRFMKFENFSDASILFNKIKDSQNFSHCYEHAKQEIGGIQEGQQQYDFGILLEKQKENDLALLMFRKAYENGIKQARKKVADLSKAKSSPIRANLKASFDQGKEMYLSSSSEQEKREALSHLMKAVEGEYPDALYFYSKIIKDENPQKSLKYRNLAIEKGCQEAIQDYGKELEDDGRTNQAVELYKSAADKGLLVGYREYARCLINSDEFDSAKNCLQNAAKLGNANDQLAYAKFLDEYSYENANDEKASYYKKSAQQGCPEAFFYYAECLCNGVGVKKDLKEAKKYYTLSFQKDPQSPTHYKLKQLIDQNLIDYDESNDDE